MSRIAWNKGTKGICKPNSGSFTSEKCSREKHWNWKGGDKTVCVDCLTKISKYSMRCIKCHGIKLSKLYKGCSSRGFGWNHSEQTKLKISESNKHKKHTEMSKNRMSESHKASQKSKAHLDLLHKSFIGKKPWNYKKKLSYKVVSAFKKGTKVHETDNWKNAIVNLRGANNPAWKGGIYPLGKCIRNSEESENWRIEVFKRDNYTCQKCLTKGGYLHAHHKVRFSELFHDFLNLFSQFSPIKDKETLLRLSLSYEPFWDINNGITLCEDCHLKKGLHRVKK